MATTPSMTGVAETLGKGLAVVWILNSALAWGIGYPAVYCLVAPYAAALYTAWGIVILYVVTAYIALMLFRGQIYLAFGGAVIFFGIVELPNLADYLFRMGGTCG